MAETEQERVNRELMELLTELRVALPGVQVLLAFLLTVPFTERFEILDSTARGVYFLAVCSCALACSLLIAPSAHHRLRFRDKAKLGLLRLANVLAVLGLGFLVVGVGSSLYLIADVLFEDEAAALVAATFGCFSAALWFLVPRLIPADGGSAR